MLDTTLGVADITELPWWPQNETTMAGHVLILHRVALDAAAPATADPSPPRNDGASALQAAQALVATAAAAVAEIPLVAAEDLDAVSDVDIDVEAATPVVSYTDWLFGHVAPAATTEGLLSPPPRHAHRRSASSDPSVDDDHPMNGAASVGRDTIVDGVGCPTGWLPSEPLLVSAFYSCRSSFSRKYGRSSMQTETGRKFAHAGFHYYAPYVVALSLTFVEVVHRGTHQLRCLAVAYVAPEAAFLLVHIASLRMTSVRTLELGWVILGARRPRLPIPRSTPLCSTCIPPSQPDRALPPAAPAPEPGSTIATNKRCRPPWPAA